MVVAALLMAALSAAAAGYLALGLVLDLAAAPRRPRRKVDVRAAAASALELAGHTAPLAKLAGWGPARKLLKA